MIISAFDTQWPLGIQTCLHSPSSVDKEPKATRSGNARLHNMTRTTAASVAYIATQVRRESVFELFTF